MISTRADLDVMLLQERVKYLESVVGILQPALEARLNGVDVMVMPERAAAPAVAQEQAIEAPARPSLPKPRERRDRQLKPTRFGKSRTDQISDMLQAAGGDVIPTGDLCRRIYGADSTTHRQALSNATKPLRDAGIVETKRGGFHEEGGYRWITEPSTARVEATVNRAIVEPRAASGVAVMERPNGSNHSNDWRAAPDLCWHVEGYCQDYTRSEFCGHCTDHDGGTICPKRHRRPDPSESVR